MPRRLSEKVALLAATFIHLAPTHATPAAFSVRDVPFSWQQLNASTSLDWVPCFDIFNCTQLEVPLDYNNTEAGTTNIAFVKYPAEQDTDTAQSVLVNGGGPGQGIVFLLQNYENLRTLLGPQFNIVGFDPRGINNSGPVVDCFGPDYADVRHVWAQDFYRETADASNTSLQTQYEAAQFYAAWCSDAIAKNESMRYISSPAVATDMLSYAQAEAKAAGGSQTDVNQVKVFYYAISYGTLIGATFASLYPDNVGRLMLDGVLDGEDYYTSSYSLAALDSDAAMLSFSRYCFEAGPGNCTFWGPSEQNITDRFNKVISSLRESPISYTGLDGSGYQPGLATYTDLSYSLILALYQPREGFPALAGILSLLEIGNGQLIAEAWQNLTSTAQIPDVDILIVCIDGYGKSQVNRSALQDFEGYVDFLEHESRYVGALLPTYVGLEICSFLDIPQFDSQVNGSFGRPFPLSAMNTSYPILFASGVLDPVTPLSSAQKAQSRFPGSSLLIQNATGHSGSYSASPCFIAAAQKYFNGTLEPNSDITCQEAVKPFQGVPGFLIE